MKRLLTDNLPWKLLSVLLAFLLWMSIAREPELATSISVPILFKNVPEELDIASDVPEKVRLEVRGPARRLTQDSLAQTEVVMDLTGAAPGERTFNIHEWNIREIPMGVTFFRAVPSQVAVRFERMLTKEVPIEPTYAKAAPEGYIVAEYRFDPPRVLVRGPENRIRNIDHVSTDPIDLSGIVGQTSRRVHVRIGDPQIRLDDNSQVKVSLTLVRIRTKDSK